MKEVKKILSHLKRSWISSRLLPLVSGTKRRQKRKMTARQPPNTQNAPASERLQILDPKFEAVSDRSYLPPLRPYPGRTWWRWRQVSSWWWWPQRRQLTSPGKDCLTICNIFICFHLRREELWHHEPGDGTETLKHNWQLVMMMI